MSDIRQKTAKLLSLFMLHENQELYSLGTAEDIMNLPGKMASSLITNSLNVSKEQLEQITDEQKKETMAILGFLIQNQFITMDDKEGVRLTNDAEKRRVIKDIIRDFL